VVQAVRGDDELQALFPTQPTDILNHGLQERVENHEVLHLTQVWIDHERPKCDHLIAAIGEEIVEIPDQPSVPIADIEGKDIFVFDPSLDLHAVIAPDIRIRVSENLVEQVRDKSRALGGSWQHMRRQR